MTNCTKSVTWLQVSATSDCVRWAFCRDCGCVHITNSRRPDQVVYKPIADWLACLELICTHAVAVVRVCLPNLEFTDQELRVLVAAAMAGDPRITGNA